MPDHRITALRRRRVALAAVVVLTTAAIAATARPGARAATAVGGYTAPATVSVFPVPGDPVASPATQITFRGAPIGQLGAITVTGSKSGVHPGRLAADSDGDGGSFIPAARFTPGEVVTVSTALNVLGGANGMFSFKVATPARRVPGGTPMLAPRVHGDVERFHSNPGLVPATMQVTRLPKHATPGDLFVGPQNGPVQLGPMILGPYGGLIWFHPLPRNDVATDFRPQTYHGAPVLTWWQGNVSAAGTGAGVDEIYDDHYRPVATIKGGNGLSADLHEFQLTPQGTALITAYYPVAWDARSVKGSRTAIVLDSVVQEIDIPTGLVLYQWDSLASVPLASSYAPLPHPANHPYDYFHINSIQQIGDGSLLVSSRNTWAVYNLSAQTGATVWQLGGKHSSFRMGAGASFAFQHDARLGSGGLMTIFDDAAGPPAVRTQSRGITLRLDATRHTATLVHQDEHRPGLLAFYEGSDQPLAAGHHLLGWGQQPYVTEFDASGRIVFDARFVGANSSYRAFRSAWSATPADPPSVAVTTSGGRHTAYASWNGATSVARWRFLGGPSRSSLKPLRTVARTAFESSAAIPGGNRVVVAQALDVHGSVLGTSAPAAG